MAADGDAKDNESDRSASEFGPPVSGHPPEAHADRPGADFGPPVSEFGPPVTEFGPPVGEFGAPTADFGPPTGTFAPVDPGSDHPELIWRPAAEPPTQRFPAPEAPAAPIEPPPARPADVPPSGGERAAWWNQPSESGGVPKPPVRGDRGLSWSEDPIAQRLAPSFHRPPPQRRQRSRLPWIILGWVAAIAAIIGLAATLIAVTRNSGAEETTAAPPVRTTAALSCPPSRDGKVTVGNGKGDTSSGAGAILGFQYGFYVDRSGEQARRFVAPDADNVSPAETIQQAINEQIPPGTTHCLRITEVGPEKYDVDLTEHRPDATTQVYRQTVITANRDGRELIYSIKNRGE